MPRVISVLTLIFLLSVTFTLWQQRRRARAEEFAQLLSSIEETLGEAEDLIGLSDDRAKELWGEAKEALEKAEALSPKSKLLASLSQQADKLLNRIEKIALVTEDHLFYDLALQPFDSAQDGQGGQVEAEALSIVGRSGCVYVAEGKLGATLAISQKKPPQVEEATANEVKGARKLAVGGDFLYLLTDKKFYRYSLKTGKADNPLTFNQLNKVAAVDLYLGSNIYFLVPEDNQIYRFYDLGGSYSGASSWLREALPLGKAVDMAIDGSIWVLTKGGVINTMAGKREPFSLKNLPLAFTDPVAIYTRPGFKKIYVADGRRALVFDKNGRFKKQFKGEALGDLVDLWVTDNEKTLFLLT
ncbi:TPA: hypothetical protein EYP26_00595, partial [Candidatus Bathyarchaeota archaeon]|nr:hypothetical protein [Candidatus Bathyarchaeota archaeon]